MTYDIDSRNRSVNPRGSVWHVHPASDRQGTTLNASARKVLV